MHRPPFLYAKSVVDQNGAVVKGANVSVVSTTTGATREALSGDEGTATLAGLSLTGQYLVNGLDGLSTTYTATPTGPNNDRPVINGADGHAIPPFANIHPPRMFQ